MRGAGEGSATGGTSTAPVLLAVGLPRVGLLRVGLLLVGLLGVSGGCANGASDADTRVATKAEPAKPEQVVQRMEPAPEPSASPPKNAPAPSAETRAVVKGGSISAKHLEAELNRLEAELK